MVFIPVQYGTVTIISCKIEDQMSDYLQVQQLRSLVELRGPLSRQNCFPGWNQFFSGIQGAFGRPVTSILTPFWSTIIRLVKVRLFGASY